MITENTKETEIWCKRSPRFKRTKCIDRSFPSNKYIKITSSRSLNRRQTSILTQMRTGHAPINSHLHRIRKVDTPYCPQNSCTNAIEDIHHLFFTCPHYIRARFHLMYIIGIKPFTMPKLFANENIIPHTLTYLNNIGRFKHPIKREALCALLRAVVGKTPSHCSQTTPHECPTRPCLIPSAREQRESISCIDTTHPTNRVT